jgi:Ala-tRNA(Pro) deacylase
MSPFGNLYELPVFAEESLAHDEQILFHAGTHEDAIRMKYDDFVKVVHPVVCAFADAR